VTGDADTRARWSGWLRAVAACGLLAACIAVPLWGAGRVLSLVTPVLLAVVMIAIVSALTVHPRSSEGGRRSAGRGPTLRTSELRWWFLIAAGGASVVLCVAVAGSISSGWVVLWLSGLVLTVPPTRLRARRFFRPADGGGGVPRSLPRSRPPSLPTQPDEATTTSQTSVMDGSQCPDARIADLDTVELCRLWRVTFWMVRDLRSPARTVHVVELRQVVLDELERQRPDAVAQWLTSGRHGADGPARYL
jgi:hypothetical protein